MIVFFFFQAEDGIRSATVTGVQTCALPIWKIGNAALSGQLCVFMRSNVRTRQCRSPSRASKMSGKVESSLGALSSGAGEAPGLGDGFGVFLLRGRVPDSWPRVEVTT